MSKSQEYFDRADNCAELAEAAISTPAKKRYQRMKAAWRALAEEQRWLDGEIAPQGLGQAVLSRSGSGQPAGNRPLPSDSSNF
jgi:hypothetical protein